MSERRTPRPHLRHYLQAALALPLWGLFAVLPVEAASALGAALLRTFGPLTKPHRIARDNLRRAFPTKDEAEITAILRAMWDNLGRNVGELPHLAAIADPRNGRITVEGLEHLEAVRDDGRPGLFFSGHLANWELMPFIIQQAGLRLHVFYRAPNNPLVDRLFRKVHAGGAGELLPKGREGARRSLELLREGEHLGVLVDQKMNDGIPVPFFGRDAMTAPALAQLAVKFDAPVVPMRITRTTGCRFRAVFEAPVPMVTTATGKVDLAASMTAVNARLEAWITDRPEQWLWVHRRWPKGS
ncbi:lipid A biosynthesis lauroyl acyltransferase [Novispirillum sp. DQ9]|uniref:lipid A biosynthesis lauroyl acyltransferase n=1 Tax=Novispirillum sp. DQ9 TaxID=3398612 RepID=UPI003C7DF7E5